MIVGPPLISSVVLARKPATLRCPKTRTEGHAAVNTSKYRAVAEFLTVVAFQLLIAVMLAPPDGGHWLRYMTTSLLVFDILLYCGFVAGGRSLPSLVSLGGLLFVVGTFAIIGLGGYVMDAVARAQSPAYPPIQPRAAHQEREPRAGSDGG